MSSMTLRLPNNYMEVERDEMEYVDGGYNYQTYWWGWAMDLSPRECSDVANLLNRSLAIGTPIMAAISTGLSKIGFAQGAASSLAAALATSNVSNAAAQLGIASNRNGATLCKKITGYTVNIW